MSQSASATLQPAAPEQDDVTRFMSDPASFFEHSITRMHSIPRHRMDELQATALSRRFAEQAERIPMVGKLAANQGIKRIDDVEAVVPLLFEHTMYKSYPVSFLGKRRFDQLTIWLNKITAADLSKIDATGCDSIDGWLDFLAEETGLDAVTTSGSTGTMSFIPRLKSDMELCFRAQRVSEVQKFGAPLSATALSGLYHVIWPTFSDGHLMSFRSGQYLKKILGGGREDHFHPLYPERGSADLMWLGAQLRAAAAKGDASRVDVPPSLLARRGELERQQAGMAASQVSFITELSETLRGSRVCCMYPSYPLHQVAARGLERGLRCEFAPESTIGSAGGAKGMPLPADWVEQVQEFFGIERLDRYYGMSELTGLFKMCRSGRYHAQPWIIPFLLDPDTSRLLPRNGVQKGRAAFFDIGITGHWGGIITGDELEIDFTSPCSCGQTTVHMADHVVRYSEKRGGDDKITCAATPQAHADALDYLTSFS